jgi:hypothetical protein
MSNQDDIPVLNDLIEKGVEITLSDLGLADDPPLRVSDVGAELAFETDDAAVVEEINLFSADPFTDDPFTDDPIADPHFSGAAALATPLAGNPFIPASVSETPPDLQMNAADALADNPALEQEVRRILDEHMELAWQEIRLAIQQHLDHY